MKNRLEKIMLKIKCTDENNRILVIEKLIESINIDEYLRTVNQYLTGYKNY
jgi:hypothetical protein